MWEVVLEKSGEKLFDLAEKQGWVDRLLAMFKKKHRILVRGSTGTGKTNLLASLTQAMPEAIAAMNRTEFATRHRINLSGTPFVFVDTPGQVGHGSRRLGAIREEMANGLSGVINVVAYGYHDIAPKLSMYPETWCLTTWTGIRRLNSTPFVNGLLSLAVLSRRGGCSPL